MSMMIITTHFLSQNDKNKAIPTHLCKSEKLIRNEIPEPHSTISIDYPNIKQNVVPAF